MASAEQQEASRRGRPRGSYAKTAETKGAILDAALAVFAQSGYRAGSLREVSEKVGMTEAGILHHFRTKGELLAAVLKHRDEQSERIMPLDPEDPLATVTGLVDLAEYNASIPGVVELYCTLSAEATSVEHPAHDYFVDRYARVTSSIEGVFRRLDEEGALRPGASPAGAARRTVALMDGLQVQWLLDRASVDMAQELRAYLRSVLAVDPWADAGRAG